MRESSQPEISRLGKPSREREGEEMQSNPHMWAQVNYEDVVDLES